MYRSYKLRSLLFFFCLNIQFPVYSLSPLDASALIEEVCALLQSGEGKDYIGEPVSQLEHALQCAQLAYDDGADEETVIAALLHDIGHLCYDDTTQTMGEYGVAFHEKVGAQYTLKHGFSTKIAQLIEGHVQAKRYLTGKYSEYYAKLSDASKETLKYQGGPMMHDEAVAFEQDVLFKHMLKMREWDEKAKQVGLTVMSLEAYKAMMMRCLEKNLEHKEAL